MFGFIKKLFSGIAAFFGGFLGGKKSQNDQSIAPKPKKSKGFYLELDEIENTKAVVQEKIAEPLKAAAETIAQKLEPAKGNVAVAERPQAEPAVDAKSTESGVLILEPISAEVKQLAAQKLARIMQIDPYTARLQLPTRGWRLYRVGPVGELQFYVSSLRQAEVPCFWASLRDIQAINVFNVNCFSDTEAGGKLESNNRASQATVVCQNSEGQLGSLTFNWSEVTQRVEGLLPLFDAVVDLDARRNLHRKTQTLDYVQFCDLHLPERRTILRLCDRAVRGAKGNRNSQFQPLNQLNTEHREPQASSLHQTTTRSNWNNLLAFLKQSLPQVPVWSDFTTFAETAIDYKEMLGHLTSHINLYRREETPWDPAFQLYSGLVFLKNSSGQ